MAHQRAVLGGVHRRGDRPSDRLQTGLLGPVIPLVVADAAMGGSRARRRVGRGLRHRVLVTQGRAVVGMGGLWRHTLGLGSGGGLLGVQILALQHAGATAGAAVDRQAGIEIVRQALARLLVGRAQQPHQQEESHHRGDKIGVGDLPGAAVMAAGDDLLALDDDRADFIGGGHRGLRQARVASGDSRGEALAVGYSPGRRRVNRRKPFPNGGGAGIVAGGPYRRLA